MRKTGWTAALPALLALLLMLTAGTALADPGWSFTEKQVVLYEGETFQKAGGPRLGYSFMETMNAMCLPCV